jgi:hypothetical protein
MRKPHNIAVPTVGDSLPRICLGSPRRQTEASPPLEASKASYLQTPIVFVLHARPFSSSLHPRDVSDDVTITQATGELHIGMHDVQAYELGIPRLCFPRYSMYQQEDNPREAFMWRPPVGPNFHV